MSIPDTPFVPDADAAHLLQSKSHSELLRLFLALRDEHAAMVSAYHPPCTTRTFDALDAFAMGYQALAESLDPSWPFTGDI